MAGFVFATYEYAGRDDSVFERAIHVCAEALLRTDKIHSEVIIAQGLERPKDRPTGPPDPTEDVLLVDPLAYTAYMLQPFQSHVALDCLEREDYSFLYLPLSAAATAEGIDELRQLVGRPYAWRGMFLTLLPRWMKRRVSRMRQVPAQVFCSEAGARVCWRCGLHWQDMPPRCVAPKDLRAMLLKVGAVPWPASRMRVAVRAMPLSPI